MMTAIMILRLSGAHTVARGEMSGSRHVSPIREISAKRKHFASLLCSVCACGIWVDVYCFNRHTYIYGVLVGWHAWRWSTNKPCTS